MDEILSISGHGEKPSVNSNIPKAILLIEKGSFSNESKGSIENFADIHLYNLRDVSVTQYRKWIEHDSRKVVELTDKHLFMALLDATAQRKQVLNYLRKEDIEEGKASPAREFLEESLLLELKRQSQEFADKVREEFKEIKELLKEEEEGKGLDPFFETIGNFLLRFLESKAKENLEQNLGNIVKKEEQEQEPEE